MVALITKGVVFFSGFPRAFQENYSFGGVPPEVESYHSQQAVSSFGWSCPVIVTIKDPELCSAEQNRVATPEVLVLFYALTHSARKWSAECVTQSSAKESARVVLSDRADDQ